MNRATILLHLPQHRERALQLQSDKAQAEISYDRHIAGYLRYLQQQGEAAGFRIETDRREFEQFFSIEAPERGEKKAAHDWLERQPDIWNWIPTP